MYYNLTGKAPASDKGANMSLTKVIIQNEFVKGTQSITLTRITEVRRGDGKPRKFRSVINRDSYDQQSFGRVELWTEAGWLEVVTLSGMNPVMRELPSYATADQAGAHRELASIAGMLESQAEEVAR